MLKKLQIKNFAIIDELSIEFSGELNLITGETGAGKSIIVGALSLLLGQKVDSKALFKSEAKCIIEGTFEIRDYGLEEIFNELEVDYNEETLLRREISTEGKSRAFINDSPVSIQILQNVGNRLVDIHSQHETLDINQESFQVKILDSVAGQTAVFEEFKLGLSEFRKQEKTILHLRESKGKNIAELDFLNFQIDELDKAKLSASDEQDRLEIELTELSHAEEIQRGLYQFSSNIDGEEKSILNQLKQSLNFLTAIEKFYPTVDPYLVRIKASIIEIRDINQELESLAETITLNSERMEMVQNRLNGIYGLEQKHRVLDLPQLISVHQDLKKKRDSLLLEDDELLKLEEKQSRLRENLASLSTRLHEGRKKILPLVQEEIKKTLIDLGIKDGNFLIDMETNGNGFTSYGYDRIRFLFSANKGFSPADLSKVASGGELSRLVLAIKTLSSKYISMPTLLFDEIDTGVSGEIALKVGRVMKKLSLKNQVIAITHLPQIASRQGDHFLVFKDSQKGVTQTQMQKLDPTNRIKEIAKMLSGNNPGEFALKNASELIDSL